MATKKDKEQAEGRGGRVVYGKQDSQKVQGRQGAAQAQAEGQEAQPAGSTNTGGMDIARIAADRVMRQQMEGANAAFGGQADAGASGQAGGGGPTLGMAQGAPAVIGEEDVREAMQTLLDYKRGKAHLEQRIIDNEQWFKLRHWEQIRGHQAKPGELESTSAWLFNSIINRHADAMDSYPKPNVLPREQSDQQEATTLSSILPVIFERAGFEQTYSDVWWYKLKCGTGAYGVFWDGSLENGLGDVAIKKLDLLNIYWEPGISNIQESRNLFITRLVDRDLLEQQYPQCKGKTGVDTISTNKFIYDDTVDTSKKVCVVDWYYKVGNGSGGHLLQYCKFVDGVVLYASENDPQYVERGYYDHGKYPVILDSMFMVEGTPAGFGYIDIMKNPQLYIDTLSGAICKNAVMHARPRFAMRSDAAVNEAEFLDGSADILHMAAAIDDTNFRQIEVQSMSSVALSTLQWKVDELKETSGNRDFSQGATTSGVTAASAIAALQEAGSKTSRDMNKAGYRAFREIAYMVIDLIRQFYSEPRKFRISGEMGQEEFVTFDNRGMGDQAVVNFGVETVRRPIFDIKVTAEKASPFSTVSQNELAKELYGMGFFNPQLADQALAALDMMDFEGRDMIRRKIQQNGTMYQQMQMMAQQMQQMAAIIDAQNGTTIAQGMAAEGVGRQVTPTGNVSGGSDKLIDAYGGLSNASKNSTAGQARTRAAEAATPR